MKTLKLLLLYMALCLTAIPVHADAELEALREGGMKKLVFHSEPKPVSDKPYQLPDGSSGQISDYEGKYVVLNFWAMWCPPCRHEMPMLQELDAELSGDHFKVVTLAVGRNSLPKMRAFFDEIGADNLPLYQDPKMTFARDMGVLGLPVTVILDPNGQEIARMQGDAEWNSESAKSIVKALIARTDQS